MSQYLFLQVIQKLFSVKSYKVNFQFKQGKNIFEKYSNDYLCYIEILKIF